MDPVKAPSSVLKIQAQNWNVSCTAAWRDSMLERAVEKTAVCYWCVHTSVRQRIHDCVVLELRPHMYGKGCKSGELRGLGRSDAQSFRTHLLPSLGQKTRKPTNSGERGVNDVELSLELAGMALHLSTGYYYDAYGDAFLQQMGCRHTGSLKPGGALLMKIYEGAGTNEFIRDMQKYFNKVVRMRVDASRSMSREFYAVGLGRKKPLPTEKVSREACTF
ncbi:hypothetical protein DUNSADRAFT_16815 [Dunaliella salina]|uniref:Ribosomal RNA methyltransferase FtsJ domain-containing protein n=1 Tax=Dunaliella salina TaxID=3046 RepID=A0ABQ7G2U5_DUNSA|nr:hypothetical protein DUNSADRAFT_16815 [Dunaliella salina]|eukprot:KAF5828923.1 hypothetical protein DUNSADRAFT_16815 [Dunaliella salina]